MEHKPRCECNVELIPASMSTERHQDGEIDVDLLLDAVHRNDIDAVRQLLLDGVDASARDSLALQIAAADGRLEIVRLLVADGRSNVRAFCSFPIRWAARAGHVSVVNALLQNVYTMRRTASHGFVLGGLAAVEAVLADSVIPVTVIGGLLRCAVETGNRAIVDRLLRDDRVDPTANHNAAIGLAAERGHLAVVESLLQDTRVDPTAVDNYALRHAVTFGQVAVVDRLLRDARVDPTALENVAICRAAQYGHVVVIDRLLQDARVDPAVRDNTPICVAAANGHAAVVERLLQDARVDPTSTSSNNHAIRWSARNGHIDIVQSLLQNGRCDSAIAMQGFLEGGHDALIKRLECRARVTEICISLQEMALPAWVTLAIVDATCHWSTLRLGAKWYECMRSQALSRTTHGKLNPTFEFGKSRRRRSSANTTLAARQSC